MAATTRRTRVLGKPLGVALALLFAGCASLGGADPGPSAEALGPRTSYLHSAMTLAAQPEPDESAVPTGAFFQAWAAGEDHPTWAADALGRDALVTSATVSLFVRVTGPVVESARFPDIMVYGGSGDAWMGYGERRDHTAFQPDQIYEVEVEIGLPQGGLWLPAAEGFGLKVVPVMLQQDEHADVEILLGGEHASRVEWVLAPLELPASTPARGTADGEVVGTIYAGPAAPPTTSDSTPIEVPAGAAYVVAWMNTTTSVGVPDIDLSIAGPGGEIIATSGTPTPREAIRIAGPNLLGGGDYALIVTTAGSPRATYRVEWIVGSP